MKNRKHTPEQIIRKLAEGKKLLGEGQNIEEVSRHLEITESTWHRWRNQYGGMKADEAKKLKELEKENQPGPPQVAIPVRPPILDLSTVPVADVAVRLWELLDHSIESAVRQSPLN